MDYDRERWNEKHATKTMPKKALELLEDNYLKASGTVALDIACGQGRNSSFLASCGFNVDAIDISDYALEKLSNLDNIQTSRVDLDTYQITENRYDLIVNSYYLNRRLFPQIIAGLKHGGVLIFETFLNSKKEGFANPSNPDFLLAENELLHSFLSLRILYYIEY